MSSLLAFLGLTPLQFAAVALASIAFHVWLQWPARVGTSR